QSQSIRRLYGWYYIWQRSQPIKYNGLELDYSTKKCSKVAIRVKQFSVETSVFELLYLLIDPIKSTLWQVQQSEQRHRPHHLPAGQALRRPGHRRDLAIFGDER